MTEQRAFTEAQINGITRRLKDDYAPHMARLRVRRMLLEMASDAFVRGNGTGTNIVAPFDESKLNIPMLIGEPVKAVQQFASMIGANSPTVSVTPIVVNRDQATQRVRRTAGEQERLLAALDEAADARRKQGQIAWSQSWGRVGWYFTLPRDQAWGMPERRYFDDITPEQAKSLIETGDLTPEPIESPRGTRAYAESGSAYMERRRKAAQQRAISARSMFILQAFGPDVVWPRYDADGVKDAVITLEIPATDCGPGSSYALSHARMTGYDGDLEKYGLYYDSGQKRVVGGITTGSEQDSHNVRTFYYSIWATREEVYCGISTSVDQFGTVVWYAKHDGGICPIIPAPAFMTDSMRPGGQYSSPMEAVFAKTPALNQIETLLSSVAGYNAIPRWVIMRKNGTLVEDPKTGDPLVIGQETTPGLDPRDASIVDGEVMQLKVDAELLYKLLEFYSAEMARDLPSPAATGQDGNDGTAWGMRQAIEQALATLRPTVDNHAIAKKTVYLLWMRWMRLAKARGEIDSVYAVALPQQSTDRHSVRGLIEFDPDDLVDAITVTQSSDTAQSKVVKQQAGIEALQAGVETMEGYFEKYTDEQDPVLAVKKLNAYKLSQAVVFGNTQDIQPGSVAADVVRMLRGELSQRLMEMPQMALSTAAQMAASARQQAAQSTMATVAQPQGGDVAGAMGLKQPGIGMPSTLESQPTGPAVAPAPMSAV